MQEGEGVELGRDDWPAIQARWFLPLQMLELDACTRCQECVEICPVVQAGFPDGAMERIAGWRRLESHTIHLISFLRRDPTYEENQAALFSSLSRCTSCGACAIVCESRIATTALWESMMGAGREMGFSDVGLEQTASTIREIQNPYGISSSGRLSWIPQEHHVADAAPVAFFAGCTVAFRQPEIGRAALRILEKTGTRFCMLKDKESCCGSLLFRTGSLEGYRDAILAMIGELERRGVKTLLVTCAGCLKTITLDWPRVFGKELPFRVLPFTVFIRDQIRAKKIRFRLSPPLRVVFHDPCHNGRHLMHLLGRDLVFEAPRDVLAAISGVEVVEFEKNREWQLCCGAGGGIKVQDPSLALTIGSRKVDDAGRLRAGVIATTCPFCRRNLGDACTASGSQFEVLDVIQLAERMME